MIVFENSFTMIIKSDNYEFPVPRTLLLELSPVGLHLTDVIGVSLGHSTVYTIFSRRNHRLTLFVRKENLHTIITTDGQILTAWVVFGGEPLPGNIFVEDIFDLYLLIEALHTKT
jgi:hypothetical protein